MPKISQDHKTKIRKKVEARRKTRNFAPPSFPDSIVLEYGKAIINEVNAIDRLVKEILYPHLNNITNTKKERLDDFTLKNLTGVTLVAELMRRIKSKFYAEFLDIDQEPSQRLFTRSARRMSSKFLKRTKETTEKKFVAEFKRQTGTEPLPQQLNVDEFVKDATRKNVALIKTIPTRYFSQIQTLTEQAVDRGQLTRELKTELSKIKETTKNSSRLIARDQISKMTGVLNEARQRKLGVTEYIWRTQNDSRVRSFSNTNSTSDHARLEGSIQSWQSPPQTVFRGKRSGERNHPTQDIQCRCTAQPVFDEITGVSHNDTVKARNKIA